MHRNPFSPPLQSAEFHSKLDAQTAQRRYHETASVLFVRQPDELGALIDDNTGIQVRTVLEIVKGRQSCNSAMAVSLVLIEAIPNMREPILNYISSP